MLDYESSGGGSSPPGSTVGYSPYFRRSRERSRPLPDIQLAVPKDEREELLLPDDREQRFRQLYHEHYRTVQAYAVRRVATPADVADVTAEVFTTPGAAWTTSRRRRRTGCGCTVTLATVHERLFSAVPVSAYLVSTSWFPYQASAFPPDAQRVQLLAPFLPVSLPQDRTEYFSAGPTLVWDTQLSDSGPEGGSYIEAGPFGTYAPGDAVRQPSGIARKSR